MNKTLMSLSLAVGMLSLTATAAQAQQLKPRIVVCTDIAPGDREPDDNESTVRLLSYADRFEIEGICCTVGWNVDPYPKEWKEYADRVIDAYSKDVKNLMKRSNQTKFRSLEEENGKQELGYWPSAEYLHSRTMYGSQHAGIKVVGEGNDSEGSDLLIRLAKEDDPRPIWVLGWGSGNTLAQAIWRYNQTATAEELKRFVQKFRIYTITDQDMFFPQRNNHAYSSHQWLRQEFRDELLFIWDESAWLNQNGLGSQNWDKYASLIQTKGNLGKTYPKFRYGVEGDTPSFLHLMPNGLNDPDQPRQAGWGGYHIYTIAPDSITCCWTNWEDGEKAISNDLEHHFYPDEFNDFAARMQWAAEGKGNHNPIVIVNGKEGLDAIEVTVTAGETLKLDASKTTDPDGDALTYSWWQQKGVGNVPGVEIEGANTATPSIKLPMGIMGNGTFHLICEVHDNGPFNLVGYRRVVVHVKSRW